MMRAFNDRELDTLYVWLGLLAVGVVLLLGFGASMVAGISNSVRLRRSDLLYPGVGGAVSGRLSTSPTGLRPRRRVTDAPGIKSVGIILPHDCRNRADRLCIDDRNVGPADDVLDHVLGLHGRPVDRELLRKPCYDIRAQEIQNRSGERPHNAALPTCDFYRGCWGNLLPAGRSRISISVPEPNKFGRYTANSGGLQIVNGFWILVAALAIYTSAFIAETVRAGIQAVDKGQTEAARSVGMKSGQITNLIVIPQALRVIIPPLNSSVHEPDEKQLTGCDHFVSRKLPRSSMELS